MRTITTYDEVSLTGSKYGKCAVCGKQATKQKKFYQTLNPYNQNSDGSLKSREDIYRELRVTIKTWRKEPVCHAECGARERYSEEDWRKDR